MNCGATTGWSVILRGHDFRLRDAPRDLLKRTREAAARSPVIDPASQSSANEPTTLRPAARPQPLLVSRFDAFARRHRATGQATRHVGRRADRHRQPAWRGGIRAGGAAGGHQTDHRRGTARRRPVRCCSTSNRRAAITISAGCFRAMPKRRMTTKARSPAQQRRPIAS